MADSHISELADLRGRRVIVLIWKDRQHSAAGGAETYCHTVAERFADQGASVCLLTTRDRGQTRRDTVGGVEIRRAGGTYSVYPLVLLRLLAWRLFAPWRLDLILDCQNGIPFFAPLVVPRRTAVVLMIFHVHQDQFGQYMSPTMARLGRWLEGPASRLVYGRRSVAVISASTRRGVRDRLGLRGPLFVVPCGSDPVPVISAPRSEDPSVVCVGRIVPHKRLDLLLRALPSIIRHHPRLHVDLIGEGPSRRELELLAAELGVADHVTFHGRVSGARRDGLVSTAWLAVNPSVGEGWGLSIIEANAAGLPAVCLNVDGLRDAVRHGETGWIAAHSDDLADTVVDALNQLTDEGDSALWSSRVRVWAASFSWDVTAAKLGNVLLAESDRLTRAKQPRQGNDLALRVRITGGSLKHISRGRRTDIWLENEGEIIGLLYGLDERDLRAVLDRLDLGDPTDVRVARSKDFLMALGSTEPTNSRLTSVRYCVSSLPRQFPVKQRDTPLDVVSPSSTVPALQLSAGLLVGATAISGLLNYGYTLGLTHWLPVRSYSAFSSSFAMLIVVGTVANAAVPWVLAQDLRRACSRIERRRSFSAGLAVNVVLGLVAAGVCALFARTFLDVRSVIALAAGALGFFVASTGMGWALGRARYRVLAAMVAGEVGIKVAAGILLVRNGAGIFGAIGAAALGSIAVIIASVFIVGGDLRPARPGEHVTRILKSSAGLSLIQGLLVGGAVLDVILVEVILPIGPQVAAYQLAATLGRASIFIAMAVTMVIFPSISGHPTDRKADGTSVFEGLSLLLVIILPLWAILSTIPPSIILHVAPSTYREALRFLPITAFNGLLWSVVIFLTCNLGASGRFRPVVVALVSCITLGGATMAIAGTNWGVWGFAIIEMLTAAAALAVITVLSLRQWGTDRLGRVAKSLPWILPVVPLFLLRSDAVIWALAAAVTGLSCLVVCFPALRPRLAIR